MGVLADERITSTCLALRAASPASAALAAHETWADAETVRATMRARRVRVATMMEAVVSLQYVSCASLQTRLPRVLAVKEVEGMRRMPLAGIVDATEASVKKRWIKEYRRRTGRPGEGVYERSAVSE